MIFNFSNILETIKGLPSNNFHAPLSIEVGFWSCRCIREASTNIKSKLLLNKLTFPSENQQKQRMMMLFHSAAALTFLEQCVLSLPFHSSQHQCPPKIFSFWCPLPSPSRELIYSNWHLLVHFICWDHHCNEGWCHCTYAAVELHITVLSQGILSKNEIHVS